MAAAETITLVLLGQPIEVSAEELDSEISPHTGRSLRQVRVAFSVAAEKSDKVSKALEKASTTEGALKGEDGSSWLVTGSSYSYSNDDPVHRYSVELREDEPVRAERLGLLGFELKPTKYEEEARDGGIDIVARVEPDAATDEALERAITEERDEPYFDVLRIGVSEKTLRMRFGRCLWQKTDTGRAHLLRLVSEQGDDEERQRGLMLLQPEFGHVARKAVAAEEAIDALLIELQSSSVLSEAAVSAIRSRADENLRKRWREFDETRDLNLHF